MSNAARINFGNGQVHYFPTVAAAKRELASLKSLNVPYCGFFRVERRIDDMWVKAR